MEGGGVVSLLVWSLLAALLTTEARAQEWGTPKFLEPAHGDDFTFEEDTEYPGAIIIYLNEHATPVIAIINYEGDAEIKSDPETDLEIQYTRADDGKWNMKVGAPCDYDNGGTKKFTYDVLIGGESAQVTVNLNNINDNPPQFVDEVRSCSFNESATGPTGCYITVRDIDLNADQDEVTVREKGEVSQFFVLEARDLNDDTTEQSYELVVVKELDYETVVVHTLNIEANDFVNEPTTMVYIVNVIDLPDTPPTWTFVEYSINIDEKSNYTNTYIATDGDHGVDAEISYRLAAEEGYSEYFAIGVDSGVFTIDEINRDALQNQSFKLVLTAYETEDPDSSTSVNVFVIVNDVNDNSPEITAVNETINVQEGYSDTIDFGISIADPDLAENGMFDIDIVESTWSPAFLVVPASGYQTASASISVLLPEKLDFEDEEWKKIELTIRTTEAVDPEHTRTKNFVINLIDINDETPEFSESPFTATLKESTPVDEIVTTIVATDKDADDLIKYSIVPSGQFLIDDMSGVVTVGRALDYETAQDFTLQLIATDEADHRAYGELRVQIEDVNDEAPTIVPESTITTVDEDWKEDVTVTTISATDPDTDANLIISIDWEESFATKLGSRQTDETRYKNSFAIVDVQGSGGEVAATLSTSNENVLDWTYVDTVYLWLTATDLNTTEEYIDTKASSSVRMTITVIDINNNPPVFREVPELSVVEKQNNVMIGSVIADDADGPGNNDVTYYIRPTEEEFDGMVTINETTGVLTTSAEINGDADGYEYIYFTVTATDGEHNDSQVISIYIKDINDNRPQFEKKYIQTSVLERSESGTDVIQLKATDKDRTAPFNTITYILSQTEDNNQLYFAVDNETGLLTVQLEADNVLTRDVREVFSINIIARDNFLDGMQENSGSDEATVEVTLEDINDNPPVFPEPEEVEVDGCFPYESNNGQILESTKKGVVIGKVEAEDKDAGENARISYSILSTTYADSGEEVEMQLFEVGEEDGTVTATVDLVDKWGTYDVLFEATDHGEVPLTGNVTYTFCVVDMNNNQPFFVYPTDGVIIRLRQENQRLNSQLYDYLNQPLKNFVVDDKDDKTTGNGQVTVTISEGGEGLFEIQELDVNTFQLILKKTLDSTAETTFELTLFAQDNPKEEDPQSVSIKITVVAITTVQWEPEFDETLVCNFTFPENGTGVGLTETIPEAGDRNNEHVDDELKEPIYYFLNGGDDHFFTLDKNTRILTLAEMLDHEIAVTHTIYVVATNYENKPEGRPTTDSSVLTCIINVEDVNDMPPVFDQELYAGGFTIDYKLTDTILTLTATDPDENDEITYELIGDISASSDGLERIKENAVKVQKNGEVVLGRQIKDRNLEGYFYFTARAKDLLADKEEGHFADVNVQVYVISDVHRVTFLFLNNTAYVTSVKEEVEQLFSDVFGYSCGVEDITQSVDADSGSPIADSTDVIAHFIDSENTLPVEKDKITQQFYEQQIYLELQYKFQEQLHLKLGSYQEAGTTDGGNIEGMLTIILIVVSAVLGTLVIVLFVAFFMRTRTLNRRLKALSQTKFGSQDSGLNRVGIAVPNTNKHAVEGSNPMWGAPAVVDYDNISQGSGDSDLIGIEDNPEFQPSKKHSHFQDGPQPRKLTGILNENFTFHPKDPDDDQTTGNAFLSPGSIREPQPRRITETLNSNFILQEDTDNNDNENQTVNPLANGKLNGIATVPVTQL